MHVNYLAILIGTLISVLFSSLYYILLNKYVTEIRATAAKETKSKKAAVTTTTTPNKLIIELTRTFVLGLVIAYACGLLGVTTIGQAFLLTAWLWLGFPVVIFTGLTLNEHFPIRLAVVHTGDWLVKLVIFTIILSSWQ